MRLFFAFVFGLFSAWTNAALAQEAESRQAVSSSAEFDAPVKIEKISQKKDSQTFEVTCYYYHHFMVKQVDAGEIGAEKLSVAASINPACTADTADEKTLQGWSGYFSGALGNYLFFDAADGINGGIPFVVFNTDGKKLFEENSLNGTKGFTSLTLKQNILQITYSRVYKANCSLYKNEKACWHDIVRKANLLGDALTPDCRKSYEVEARRTPEFANSIFKSNSVIGYDALLTYDGSLHIQGSKYNIACWLPD